jgi:hypothetical protein
MKGGKKKKESFYIKKKINLSLNTLKNLTLRTTKQIKLVSPAPSSIVKLIGIHDKN